MAKHRKTARRIRVARKATQLKKPSPADLRNRRLKRSFHVPTDDFAIIAEVKKRTGMSANGAMLFLMRTGWHALRDQPSEVTNARKLYAGRTKLNAVQKEAAARIAKVKQEIPLAI